MPTRARPAVAEFARCFFHLVLAPDHFFLADRDDLFGCVGDHFGAQFADECFASDRVADDVARVTGACRVVARSLKVPLTSATAWTTLKASTWATRSAAARCTGCLRAFGANTDDAFSYKI